MQRFPEQFETIFGAPTHRAPLSAERLRSLKSSICESHFACLEKFGQADFHDGLVRLVDPEEYSTLPATLLANFPIFANQKFYPVLIGAFGQVDLIDVTDGLFLRFQLFENRIMFFEDDVEAGKREGADSILRKNLLASDPEDCDLLDDDGNSIFKQLTQKLGPLGQGEIFALTPEPSEDDGELDLEIEMVELEDHLQSVDLYPQLVTL